MNGSVLFMLGSLWAMIGAVIVWMFWTALESAIGKTRRRKITVRMAAKRFFYAMMVVVFWPFGITLVWLWTLKRSRAFFLRLIFGKKKANDRTPVRRHAQGRTGSHRAAQPAA